jgi:hypothetical protein
MAKKKMGITIEMLEKRVNWEDMNSVRDAISKFFYVPEGDSSRPSQELALWFLNKIYDGNPLQLQGNVSYLLELGYFTYEEMLEAGVGHILARYIDRVNFQLEHKENPYPVDIEKLEKLLARESIEHRQMIAEGMLTRSVKLVGSKFPNVKKSYIEFMKKGYGKLAVISGLSEDQLWRRAVYLPTPVIMRRFRESFGFLVKQCETLGMFERRCSNSSMPYEQIVDELLPAMAELPLATGTFPYCMNMGCDALLSALDDCALDLAKDKEGRRNKVYNLVIKPLLHNDAKIMRNMSNGHTSVGQILSYLARIAGAVVPAGELVNFVTEVVFRMEPSPRYRRCHVEEIARIKTKANLPVSREFIDLQYKVEIYEGRICYNNRCINDLDFWLQDRDRDRRIVIFPSGLAYNDSFSRNFKLRVEDLDFFRTHAPNVGWSPLCGLEHAPKEYLVEFAHNMPLHYLSREILATLDEETVGIHLAIGNHVPNSFFMHNKSLSAEFIGKHAGTLLNNRGPMGHYEHIKLSDVVAALED